MASPPDYYISSDYSPYDDSSYAQPQPATLHNKIIVAAIVVLFCLIFFILSLHICGKWPWRSLTGHSDRQQFHWRNEAHVSAALMRSDGLSKDTVMLLPSFTYRAPTMVNTAASVENESSLECTVCLSEFEENERGRILPACKHSFHTECIDMWLYSHSTCPLCRTVVMPTSSSSASALPSNGHQERGHEEEEVPVHEVRIAIDSTASATSSGTHVINYLPGTEVLPVPQPEPTHNIERPSPSSVTNHKTVRRVMPHITIEIPTRQDMRITSPGCMSLSSWRLRCRVSPRDQSCASHTSVKSPGIAKDMEHASR